MRSNLIKRITASLLMAVMIFGSSLTALAAETEPLEDNRGWIRAKLTYEFDDGVTGLSDDIIEFVDGWSKIDDWYYYKDPVKPGDKVRFMTGVKVPADWTEKIENKKFQVIVTVEASEVAPKETGWDKNTKVLYSENYDVWSAGYKTNKNVVIREGKLDVTIHEYQLDENGKEVTYVNDKIIVPGQKISKIVEFELSGKLGGLEKVIEKPKPVEKIIEVIKTGQNTFLLAGIVGLAIMAGGGYALYKKKKGEGAA